MRVRQDEDADGCQAQANQHRSTPSTLSRRLLLSSGVWVGAHGQSRDICCWKWLRNRNQICKPLSYRMLSENGTILYYCTCASSIPYHHMPRIIQSWFPGLPGSPMLAVRWSAESILDMDKQSPNVHLGSKVCTVHSCIRPSPRVTLGFSTELAVQHLQSPRP